MLLWQFFLILAMFFIIIEIFLPTMFFLNFALGCILTSAISLYVNNLQILTVVAVLISAIFLVFLRPVLIKQKKQASGIEDKYIGKVVKVTEPINENGGAITIYGERWSAKAEEEIPAGVEVKIIKNDSLIFYVERI